MHVEIWSDIACPWCYVGRAQFAAALAQFEHRDEVTVTWRAFELDPDAPPEREGTHAEQIAAKYGRSLDEVARMDEHLQATAAAAGLDVRLAPLRSGNTFDAHRLVHLAAAHDRQDAMQERLFRAYFTDGALMSDAATLEALAVEVGLPADEAREVLLTERYAEEVRDDERTASQLGIRAVPCFVIDRKLGASGAQQPDIILAFLREGWAQRDATAAAAR